MPKHFSKKKKKTNGNLREMKKQDLITDKFIRTTNDRCQTSGTFVVGKNSKR